MDFFQTFNFFQKKTPLLCKSLLCVIKNVVSKKFWKKSIAALHRLTQDVQHSTRYPKTHVGGPDLDHSETDLILVNITFVQSYMQLK